eukprot:127703_1
MKQQQSSINANKTINSDCCILSMFAADCKNETIAAHAVPLRISPFNNHPVVPIKFNEKYKYLYKEVKFDNTTNNANGIYYYNIGTWERDNFNDILYFNTPLFTWPNQYTLILWIKWSSLMNFHITFDSHHEFINDAYAPLTMSTYGFGVSSPISNGGWEQLYKHINKDTELPGVVMDKWQFVVGIGGINDDTKQNIKHCTSFYVGDLDNGPANIGFVESDICGLKTNRIGNGKKHKQGPGPIACILVFNYHLDSKQLENIYWETKNEIGMNWNDEQVIMVRQNLLKYLNEKK